MLRVCTVTRSRAALRMPATSLGALLINAAAARERIKEATIPACPKRQREAAVFEVEMLDQTRLAQASSDMLGRFVLGFEGLNERKAHQIRKPAGASR